MFLSFGHAAIPDGYGVSYGPKQNRIKFSISSFNSCAKTDPIKFCAKLMECLRDMKALLSPGPAKIRKRHDRR